MKRVLGILFLLLQLNSHADAATLVFACEPEWASLAKEIGGERVEIYAATTAFQDPHHIEARPSLIAKVRRADLVFCTGAELETGWLPLLLRQASNAKLNPGKPGYLEAAMQVERLEIPNQVDRSMGDIHAAGNPHVHLDPHRLLTISASLLHRLQQIDPANASYYQTRYDDFFQRWQQAVRKWETLAAPLKGSAIIVHHRDWVYLADWLGIKIIGAIEPKPGLPTRAGHLVKLKQRAAAEKADFIVRTAYQSPRAAKRLAELTGLPVIELPYTVGGNKQAKDLFGLFDSTIAMLQMAKP